MTVDADFQKFTEQFVIGETHRFTFTVGTGGLTDDARLWRKFWVTAKRSLSDADADAVFQLTSLAGGGITPLNPDDVPGNLGKCLVEIPAVATEALPNTRTVLFGDIKGIDPDGKPWSLARGTFLLIPAVTQAVA